MALSDPQAVTFNGAPVNLARTDLAKNKGSFVSSDGLLELTISSTFNAKTGASTLVRLDQKKSVTGATGVASIAKASVWIVCRRLDNGTWSTSELAELAETLSAFAASANYQRVLVGEA